MTEEQLAKLQNLQNKCIKYITKQVVTPSSYHNTRILRIREMIELANLKFGYKLQNRLLPIETMKLCWTDSCHSSLLPTHNYNTRNKQIPNLPHKANKTYRDSFLYKGPRSILTLNKDIRDSRNLSTFTMKSKDVLLKKYCQY